MNPYRIRAVGEPMGPWIEIEAHTAVMAVAEVAGCTVEAVCLPINHPRLGASRFMPRDDTGRQWELEDTRITPIIDTLRASLHAAGNCTIARGRARTAAEKALDAVWRGSKVEVWRTVHDWYHAINKEARESMAMVLGRGA